MTKIFARQTRWKKIRDDNSWVVFEKRGLFDKGFAERNGLPWQHTIMLQVSFSADSTMREEWLGAYNSQLQQYGISFNPREDFPELTKVYRQVK